MAPLVWLITGTSAGFGFALCQHALSNGHKVVATVRSRTKSSAVVGDLEAAGAKVVELDVTNAASATNAIKQAESAYGQIDVLVNNAGYSLLGAAEDITDEEAEAQLQTNFHGPLRLIRAVLPGFRSRRSGTIVNVSSIAGLDGLPSCALYAASKFALEGYSESLAREVSPFGISVLIVEPGAFRTNFLSAMVTPKSGLGEAYKGGPVDEVLSKFDAFNGTQQGDPAKGAARMFEVVTGDGMAGNLKGKILRLPLGEDCVARWEQKVKSLTNDLQASRNVALSTKFSEST